MHEAGLAGFSVGFFFFRNCTHLPANVFFAGDVAAIQSIRINQKTQTASGKDLRPMPPDTIHGG
jgi:hypothetical protein